MGVPALFRWLSRKYPKIVLPVVEEQPVVFPGPDGSPTEIPVDITKPNPNGQEVDCLYLDMNGIVHPCTHPEGKTAPKTEAAMMVEVFKYTERVINMARPRKVIHMAIDGVAPRAKMNQQRSRRFRSAEEAKQKAIEREQAIKEWEALGKTMSDEYKNEQAWDSNAITPGTPFMDLLASSLRYWVAYKLNTDAGWAGVQVIISDASVPGEGEHKIMDFVRRQRSQPGYDPNTTHVFYGLDADLIMLSLATHEPNFKILREDVFAQSAKRGCHKCGLPGHHSSKCLGITPEQKIQQETAAKSALKPFIFLDVSVLREYLQIELDIPGLPFAFDLERAIDDWVFMIFFVGNDFLPHLPSLDIREGAIDMLLEIWRRQLPQMGGYLTDNGRVDLEKAQYIMDGLAAREDDIFKKRRAEEERQSAIDQEKRRRIEGTREYDSPRNFQNGHYQREENHQAAIENTPNVRNGVEYVPVVVAAATVHPSASGPASASNPPQYGAVGAQPPKPKNPMFISSRPVNAPIRGGFVGKAQGATGGTNGSVGTDTLANRAAIRKANMSAADLLRAELAGAKKPAATDNGTNGGAATSLTHTPQTQEAVVSSSDAVANDMAGNGIMTEPDGVQDAVITQPLADEEDVEEDVPASAVDGTGVAAQSVLLLEDSSGNSDSAAGSAMPLDDTSDSPRGKKRSADDAGLPATKALALLDEEKDQNGESTPVEDDDDDEDDDSSDDANITGVTASPSKRAAPKPLKMLGGNMVEQEDTVKLWEPGYKERYYDQKFGVLISDVEFRRSCAKSYVEGLCWVLAYYYQGCPSWTWYYPHHFAPFASDFTDLATMEIKFDLGKPFRPFEQLMGVFPAASRKHIPEAFQGLMIEEDSEIIDFYPAEFDVDMNGKKMLWQGVALLPFIDQQRLLEALDKRYGRLTDDENKRNAPGNEVVFVAEDNRMFDQITSLYMKRKVADPMPIDATLSRGVRGAILPDESCVPNSTFVSPLPSENLSDIKDDRSISALYFVCSQATAHRSLILPGYRPVRRVLNPDDINKIHRGLGGGDDRGSRGDGCHAQRRDLEGPGHVRRDARSVQDPRREGGAYVQQSRPQWETPGYNRDTYSQGHQAYPAPHQYSQPPYNNGVQQGYGTSSQSPAYGGYGGRGNAGNNPEYSNYGYGGQSSHGGYSSSNSYPGATQSRPPSYGSYQPSPPTYGGYGNAAPPNQPPQQYQYGYAPPTTADYGSYRPPAPPQHSYPGQSNRGAPLPSHLQQPGGFNGQAQHRRW